MVTGCQLFTKKGLSDPVLDLPLDQATGVQLPVALSWGACEGEEPIRYTVYLDTNPNPTTPLANAQGIAQTNVAVADLQAGATYYWKVKAYNSQLSKYSATRRFTVAGTAPSVPVLTSPANGSQVLSEDVLLRWNAASGTEPLVYDIYFGNAPDILPLVGQNLSETSFARAGLANGSYYWRVVAKNDYGERNSAVYSFTVTHTAPVPPSAPILLHPINDAAVAVQPVTLQWEASLGDAPIRYDVYADTTENPTAVVAGNVTATTWTMPALSIGRYYWKVIAKNEAGQASSDVWAFDMTSTEFATLTAPVPLTPANGATVAQNFATLRWSASSGATPITYDVYFDQNPFPITLVATDLVGFEHPVTGLTDGPYYWRVVGKNVFETAESSTASFTVFIPSSPAAVYLEKIDARSFRIRASQPFALSESVSMTFDTQIPLESGNFFPRGMIEGMVSNPVVPLPNVGSSVDVIYSNVSGYLNGNPLTLSSGDLTIATVTFENPPTGSVSIIGFSNGAEEVAIGATSTVFFTSGGLQGVYLEKLPGGAGFRIKTVSPLTLGTAINMKLISTLTPALESTEFSPNGKIAGIVPNPIVSLPDIVYQNQAEDLNGTVLYTGGSDLTIATVTFASTKTGSVVLTEFRNDGVAVPLSSLNGTLTF